MPSEIWLDKLSAAFVLDHGGRVFTDDFSQFCAHYRLVPQFCNPASGNEKGHMENKAGYGRRNWCVPPPVIETPEQSETYLAESAKANMQRQNYAKHVRIVDLWEQERPKLLQMPMVSLEVYRLENARLNKYSELQFESTLYPLPQCQARLPVLLKVKWDVMDVLSSDGAYQRLATLPRPYTEKAMPIDWPAIFEGYRRRPRSVLYSTFVKLMPSTVQQFLQVDEAELRKSRILLLGRLLGTYTLEEISEGLSEVQPIDEYSQVVLDHVVYANKHPEFHPEPFTESHTPESLQGQVPQLDAYDRLLGVPMS